MDTIDVNVESYVETELARLQGPAAYYAVSSPYERDAVAGQRVRRADHEMWQRLLPDLGEDHQLVIARLKRSLGRGEGYLSAALYAHQRLREMPLLRAQQESTFHLDLDRLKAIDSVMSKADANDSELIAKIDVQLSEYLTPTRANQLLPSAAEIRRKLNAIIQALDDSISTDDKPTRDRGRVEVVYDGDRAFLTATLDPVDAREIEKRVRRVAKREKITEVEALSQLVKGEAKTDITLNVYQAHDVRNAPGWIPGIGYIGAARANELAAQAGKIQNMDQLYARIVADYKTPADIRAVVIGWDGTCATGYCTCDEDRTQMDHRIDHKDGGPTTAGNLSAQCPTHHNMKTDGLVHYFIEEHTRDKYFLYEDGNWVVVEANGPLTPKERHWVQTMAQRTNNRRDRIRGESQEKRLLENLAEPQPPPPEPDPPPPF